MNLLSLAIRPEALEPRFLVLPLLFGFGLYLVLTAQPLGRPKPDLRQRLDRLDVDARIRMELTQPAVQPIFASRALELIMRPFMEDVGRLLRAVLSRFGLGGGQALERRLRLLRPGVEPVQFFGEKVVCGFIGFGCFPLMNAVGIHPFGPWPVWAWTLGFAAGFLCPDAQLDQAERARRTRCLMELPALLEMLTIAASAGLALEQAVSQVSQQSSGTVAQELRRASREAELGQRPLVEALNAMAERNRIPELTSFVGQLCSAYSQGLPLVEALSAQADALRERKRLRVVEAGGRAGVLALLPAALFIFPVIFIVELVPATLVLMHIGGR